MFSLSGVRGCSVVVELDEAVGGGDVIIGYCYINPPELAIIGVREPWPDVVTKGPQ